MTEYYVVHAQGGVPAIGGGPLSARPAPGQPGRVYFSNEGTIYRDTGASWSALSGDDAASILEKLLTVDANDSGLNATTFQGAVPSDFQPAGSYAASNDSRFHTRNHNLFSSDHPDVNAADAPANAEVLTFNSTTGKWESAPPGALTVPDANETTRGKSENSTTAEVQAGALDSPYFVSPLKLAAEITRRLTPEAWITPTLTNGWVPWGAPFEAVAYYKDPLGRVHLKGTVKSGTNNAIFTLPIGYRPALDLLFPVVATDAGAYRVAVRAAGGVEQTHGTAAQTSLNGISFRV